MMKLYTCYSDSHKILFDNYFYPSLPEDVDLVVTHLQQIGDGSYKNSGWRLSMMEKVKVILRALDENDYFIWSDCDVQFFGPIVDTLLSELGDFELACQNDSRGLYCAGFFICKSTPNTKKLFRNIFEIMLKESSLDDDQEQLNKLIKNCKGKFLSNRFWTVGVSLEENSRSLVCWSDQDFEIPQNILVHHANWTVGIENKIKLLEMVRKNALLI